MKILINIPKIYGGVYNHYWGLYPYWNENVKYNSIGRRSWKKNSGILWLPWDLIRFVLTVIFWKPDVIVVNPSFTLSAISRDVFFIKLAFFLKKKVFVFFHGWHKEEENNIDKKKLTEVLNKVSGIIVLAQEFELSLKQMGVVAPIHKATTKVNDNLLQDFNINDRSGCVNTLLFLARVEKEKGIFTLLDAFAIIKKKYSHLHLRVVGDGEALTNAIRYVDENKIKDVFFSGRLSGKDLAKEFIKGDLYILPTYHGEGMPASVLEAMAFGLPIITRPVGGLIDFFTNQMGVFVESLDPQDYVYEIEKYIKSSESVKEISIFNYNFAKENFLASSVARKIESILRM